MQAVQIDAQIAPKAKAKGNLTRRQVKSALLKVPHDPNLVIVGNGELMEIWLDRDTNEYFKGGDSANDENYGDRALELLNALRVLWEGFNFHTSFNGSYYRVIAGSAPVIDIDYCNPSHPMHY